MNCRRDGCFVDVTAVYCRVWPFHATVYLASFPSCCRLLVKFALSTGYNQGCGLGLDVSVSRRSRDVPTSRLGLVSRKIVKVSVSSRSREADVSVSSRSRAFTSRAQDSFLMGMQIRSVNGL